MALLELAAHARSQGPEVRDRAQAEHRVSTSETARCAPLSLTEIAQAQALSVAYLEQIFAKLRRAGIVESARGPGGGYRLARPLEGIMIGAVIDAVDESISATRCGADAAGCVAGQRCRTHDLWAELGQQIDLFLRGISLADVLDGHVCGRAMPPRAP
ncbi:Rrf2 family transcriptional regulator [Pseudoroseomonas globiformis]|uniref:Rrf2 family transcriptional regulator n=1 Tax=Teichococcus globiformis TaxID=2307229 RepID=A0ABV7FZX6_9PROT